VENEGREEAEEGIWFGYTCGGKPMLLLFVCLINYNL
jgi:hypothetical protein